MNSNKVPEKRKHSEAGTTTNSAEVLIAHASISTSKRLKHSEGENFVEIKDIVKDTVSCYSDIHNLSPDVVLFIFNLRHESGMLGV